MVEDYNSLIGIGAIIAALVSLVALIFTIKQNNDVKYLDFIKNVDCELKLHLEKEKTLKGKEDCLVYAYNYIDICDRIMFLIKTKKIKPDFYDYYLDFFNYAITILWWYTTIYPEDKHSIKSSWPSLTKWISEKGGDPYPLIHLPQEMKNILEKQNITIDETVILKELNQRIISSRK